MEYLDFSSVITIIRKYINDERTVEDKHFNIEVKIDQIHLLEQVFSTFCNDETERDFAFDNGQVCRWFNGQARISPRIISFYLKEENKEMLSADMEYQVLPLMYDSAMAAQELHTLLLQDTTISNEVRNELAAGYPCRNDKAKADFMATVLFFGMEREFRKRDANTKNLLAAGSLSPVLKDLVYGVKAPAPCRYFCGRDTELAALHELLGSQGKVFLQGIAGIGKSELAKAYAKRYGKEYTNIIYFTYTGDLKRDIAGLDFADDVDDSETMDARFSRHHRLLRKLREDSLLIIDNFNTVTAKDSLLDVVLNYHCRIIFTTRSRFDNYTSMNLEEIADTESLLSLMGCFYSDAEKHRPILEQIIQTVHRHTLAVELSARLLETGILEPPFLLKKLKEEKAALDTTDTIGITKDGRSRKATYYDHIHTLFSLYQLSDAETELMRNLSLAPLTGIPARLFANWLNLRDMNSVNDLIEKGFVQTVDGRAVTLHPMIQEVAMEETRPSVQSCRTLLDSTQSICLLHGCDIPYYRQMFQMVGVIIERIENDDMPFYLRFLEDVYPYMDKYHDSQGMELVLNELSALLKDRSVGSVSDRALLTSYRAYGEKKPDKAIKLQKEAIAMLPEIAADNALLVSNLYSNLGGMYKQSGKLELAKQNMEQAIQILEQYGLTQYHDSIVQISNYAVLLTDMGQPDAGLSALQKLSRLLREYHSDKSLDYANVQEAMGGICLTIGDIQQATTHFKKMMAIYEVVFDAEPEVIEAKKQELMGTYTQAGLYLGQQLLKQK